MRLSLNTSLRIQLIRISVFIQIDLICERLLVGQRLTKVFPTSKRSHTTYFLRILMRIRIQIRIRIRICIRIRILIHIRIQIRIRISIRKMSARRLCGRICAVWEVACSFFTNSHLHAFKT